MKIKVIKRNGDVVDFNEEKIRNAITKGFLNYGEITEEKKIFIKDVIKDIQTEAQKYTDGIEVEEIQDIIVAKMRKAGFRKVAKGYQEYREKRAKARELNAITEILSNDETEEKTENGNVDGFTTMGRMLHVGEEVVKQYSLNNIFSPEVAQAHKDGHIYFHDLGFAALGCTTCLQIPLDKLFKGGFSTGHGWIREPGSIGSAASLAAVAIQANQNEHHGGQSIPLFDYYLAPYVLKSFNKEYKKYLYCLDRENDFKEFPSMACAKEEMQQNDYEKVLKMTEKATYQAMEAFIHNMCSLNSRAGSQVPFSSINFGLETSIEGRMVVEQYLKAHIAGLGRGETSIFPIAIYTLKKGINFNPEDPNYDLFRLAMECSSKRQFPTYAFVDSSFNLPYYEKDNIRGVISYMGKCKCSSYKIF